MTDTQFINALTVGQISLIYQTELQKVGLREKWPSWVAFKGVEKEYGDNPIEAVTKLCDKLGIGK